MIPPVPLPLSSSEIPGRDKGGPAAALVSSVPQTVSLHRHGALRSTLRHSSSSTELAEKYDGIYREKYVPTFGDSEQCAQGIVSLQSTTKTTFPNLHTPYRANFRPRSKG
jgi:hypothetical protein